MADIRRAGAELAHVRAQTDEKVSGIFVTFSLLLVTNVVLYWLVQPPLDPDAMTREEVASTARFLTAGGAVDTVLVLLAWFRFRGKIAAPPGLGGRAGKAWLAAAPVLGLLLLANLGYHRALNTLFGVTPEADLLMQSGHCRVWLLALICIQPALVEELFFRRLCLDFFARYTGVGTAALVSAIMFAGAHTFGLASFPYLVLFGLGMAWMRILTGSLWLPVTLHLLHNFIISLP